MIRSQLACQIARSLPDVSEKDHFGSDAFYANKRIFATIWHDKKQVNVKLTPDQQRTYIDRDSEAFGEIDNAWGRQGWTTIHLGYVDRSLFTEALRSAWNNSGTKKVRAAAPKAIAKKPKAVAKKKAAKKPVVRKKA